MAGVVTKRILAIACLLGTVFFSAAQGQLLRGTGALIGPISLDSLTHYMNIHTDIRLTFNAGKISGRRPVRFPGRTYDLNGLLAHIQKNTGLTWSLYGKHVIFREDHHKIPPPIIRKKPAPPKKTGVDTPVIIRQKNTGPPVNLAIIDTIKRGPVSIDTRTRTRIHVRTTIPAPENGPAKTVAPSSSSKWLLHAGVFANEVFYVNGGIEAGIKPVSLLFSVGSNFHVTTWHIGLQSGNLFKHLPERMSFHITAGYSPLSAVINVDSGLQHTTHFNVKGQLYDLGFTAYSRHGKHWLFKAGIEWRLLKTSYYIDGTLTSPARYFSQGQNPDKTLYLLRPPLKFVNTFDRNSGSNIKFWPGISIGVYYNFLR